VRRTRGGSKCKEGRVTQARPRRKRYPAVCLTEGRQPCLGGEKKRKAGQVSDAEKKRGKKIDFSKKNGQERGGVSFMFEKKIGLRGSVGSAKGGGGGGAKGENTENQLDAKNQLGGGRVEGPGPTKKSVA